MTEQSQPKTFEGRFFLIDDDIIDDEVWCYELEPMNSRRSVRRWATEHMGEIYWKAEDRRKLFELPEKGNFQVLYKATIRGWHCSHTDEWDEEVEIVECQREEIPEDYAKMMVGED